MVVVGAVLAAAVDRAVAPLVVVAPVGEQHPIPMREAQHALVLERLAPTVADTTVEARLYLTPLVAGHRGVWSLLLSSWAWACSPSCLDCGCTLCTLTTSRTSTVENHFQSN